MGVFGAGIFADDDALDVRGDYKYFLADTQSDELATEAMVRRPCGQNLVLACLGLDSMEYGARGPAGQSGRTAHHR